MKFGAGSASAAGVATRNAEEPRSRFSSSVSTHRSRKIHQPACTIGALTTTATRIAAAGYETATGELSFGRGFAKVRSRAHPGGRLEGARNSRKRRWFGIWTK